MELVVSTHLSTANTAPQKLQQMLLDLQEYDMKIKYKPGKEMILPDGLSRLPNEDKNEPIPLDVRVNFVQFSESKLDELKKETAADAMIAILIDVVIHGWPERQRRQCPYVSFGHTEMNCQSKTVLCSKAIDC
jgi:hypothetical protein